MEDMEMEINFEKLLDDEALAAEQDYYERFGDILFANIKESVEKATAYVAPDLQSEILEEAEKLSSTIADLRQAENEYGAQPLSWYEFKPDYFEIKEELNRMEQVLGSEEDAAEAKENGWDKECGSMAIKALQKGKETLSLCAEKIRENGKELEIRSRELQSGIERVQAAYPQLPPEMTQLISSLSQIALSQTKLIEQLQENSQRSMYYSFPNMFASFQRKKARSLSQAISVIKEIPERIHQAATERFFGFLHEKFQPIVDSFNTANDKINDQIAKVEMEREVFREAGQEKITSAVLRVISDVGPNEVHAAAHVLTSMDTKELGRFMKSYFSVNEIYRPTQINYDEAMRALFAHQSKDEPLSTREEAMVSRIETKDNEALEKDILRLLASDTRSEEMNSLLREGIALKREHEEQQQGMAMVRS